MLMMNPLMSVYPHVLQFIQSTTEEGDIQDLLTFGAGIFALVLFSLSLYAWARRRQPSLLVVSAAFILFFVKAVIQLIPQQTNASNLFQSLLDFAVLAAFFIAIVLGPRKRSKADI